MAKQKLPSKAKSREILHDGTAQGHPLTDKQRRFFGWVASMQTGGALPISDYNEYLRRKQAYDDSLGLYNLSNKLRTKLYSHPHIANSSNYELYTPEEVHEKGWNWDYDDYSDNLFGEMSMAYKRFKNKIKPEGFSWRTDDYGRTSVLAPTYAKPTQPVVYQPPIILPDNFQKPQLQDVGKAEISPIFPEGAFSRPRQPGEVGPKTQWYTKDGKLLRMKDGGTLPVDNTAVKAPIKSYAANPYSKPDTRGGKYWEHRDPTQDSDLENKLEYIPVLGSLLGINDWMDAAQNFYEQPSWGSFGNLGMETLGVIPFGNLVSSMGKGLGTKLATKAKVAGAFVDGATTYATDETRKLGGAVDNPTGYYKSGGKVTYQIIED